MQLYLAPNCDVKEFANTFRLSPQHVHKCLNIKDENNELLIRQVGIHHEKKTDIETLHTIVKWFEKNTYIYFKHGKESGVRTTSVSINQLFIKFKLETHNQAGRNVFMRAQKELHILKSHHQLNDLFSCPKCHQLGDLFVKLEFATENDRNIIQTKINKVKLHKTIAEMESFPSCG